jgi:hypothetical protein
MRPPVWPIFSELLSFSLKNGVLISISLLVLPLTATFLWPPLEFNVKVILALSPRIYF